MISHLWHGFLNTVHRFLDWGRVALANTVAAERRAVKWETWRPYLNWRTLRGLPLRFLYAVGRAWDAMVRFLVRLVLRAWNWLWAFFTVLGNMPLRQVLKTALILATSLLLLIAAGITFAILYPSSQVEKHVMVDQMVYLEQGWGTSGSAMKRQQYYRTPQGTTLLGFDMRLRWLEELEQAGSREKLIEPGHMRALGFVVDDIATDDNPHRLPVGITGHFEPGVGEDVVDITCAACHTGALDFNKNGKNIAIRIDGGQAMHSFTSNSIGQFGPDLLSAMAATYFNPFKFHRFANSVLGNHSWRQEWTLQRAFSQVFFGLLGRGGMEIFRGLYPVEEGFGRVDAVGRISNQVFGWDLDSANYHPANAPVNYPPLWDITKFDWVQYTGSVQQPMARNLNESLGTFAHLALLDPYGRALPEDRRFNASSKIDEMVVLENAIRLLKPPLWPEQLFGKIDTAKAAEGKLLYEKHCAGCHAPCLKSEADIARDSPGRLREPEPQNRELWRMNRIPVQDVGTDPTAALNFVNHRVNLEKTGITANSISDLLRFALGTRQKRAEIYAKEHGQPPPPNTDATDQQVLDGINIRSASVGQGLNYIGMLVRKRFYREHNFTPQNIEAVDGYGALDLPEVTLVYKARPLAGMWATPPFLHNGSVPTLYELLLPAAQRSKRFFITARLNFDPVRVGLVGSQPMAKGFWLDTTIPGNFNIGHEFRAGYAGYDAAKPAVSYGVIGPELRDAERWAIIEYLKIHIEQPKACK